MSGAEDELLVRLGGASIYARRDAPTFLNGAWLETEAMTFWLEVLAEEAAARAASSSSSPSAAGVVASASAFASASASASAASCAFVHPSAVAMHELCDSAELCDALSGLGLRGHASAVFPVCNAGVEGSRALSHAKGSGSHWSLLAWAWRPPAGLGEPEAHALVHFDSVAGSGNASHARRFAASLWPLLGGGAPLPALREGPCAQQGNASDCGVHALMAAELVAAAVAAGRELGALDLRASTTPAHAADLRARMRRELSRRAAAYKAGSGGGGGGGGGCGAAEAR